MVNSFPPSQWGVEALLGAQALYDLNKGEESSENNFEDGATVKADRKESGSADGSSNFKGKQA